MKRHRGSKAHGICRIVADADDAEASSTPKRFTARSA